MTKAVECKVAAVVSDHELVLNVGQNEGVKERSSVELYRTVDITDPDTSEALGSVRVPFLRLEVVEVQARLSVAEVTDREPDPPDSPRDANIFASALRGPRPLKRITAATRSGKMSDWYTPVKAGQEAIIEVPADDVEEAQ